MKKCKVISVGVSGMIATERAEKLAAEINRYEAHGYQIKAVTSDYNNTGFYIFLEKDVKPQP